MIRKHLLYKTVPDNCCRMHRNHDYLRYNNSKSKEKAWTFKDSSTGDYTVKYILDLWGVWDDQRQFFEVKLTNTVTIEFIGWDMDWKYHFSKYSVIGCQIKNFVVQRSWNWLTFIIWPETMLICILKTLINFTTIFKPIVILFLINYHKARSKARHKGPASSD